jgi:hypothetical protein
LPVIDCLAQTYLSKLQVADLKSDDCTLEAFDRIFNELYSKESLMEEILKIEFQPLELLEDVSEHSEMSITTNYSTPDNSLELV